jgi:hypothetical protein
VSDVEKYIAIGIAVFIVFALISILVLCQAIGEADRHSERMMNDKEDKGE